MYEDQVLILKYCMQEYRDKFVDTLAKALLDADIKIGVRVDWEIKSEHDGNLIKYKPEFQANHIEIDFSAHDEKVRDELIKELIEKFPKIGGSNAKQ